MSKINIQIGNIYKTRDGRKAFISNYNFNFSFECYEGIIVGDSNKSLWDKNGFSCIGDEHYNDIVCEWTLINEENFIME